MFIGWTDVQRFEWEYLGDQNTWHVFVTIEFTVDWLTWPTTSHLCTGGAISSNIEIVWFPIWIENSNRKVIRKKSINLSININIWVLVLISSILKNLLTFSLFSSSRQISSSSRCFFSVQRRFFRISWHL